METIKINDMQTKGVVFIVKYTNGTGAVELEATLNTGFNKQEIWYLENEVGVGGTVSVEIVNKEKQAGNPSAGFWVNITKVDMKSAVKDINQPDHPSMNITSTQTADIPKPTSDREKTIIAQCLTKIVYRNAAFANNEEALKEVLDAYNYFLGEL